MLFLVINSVIIIVIPKRYRDLQQKLIVLNLCVNFPFVFKV